MSGLVHGPHLGPVITPCGHAYYGGSVCALCGQPAPEACRYPLTCAHQPGDACQQPEPVINPQAFRDGERLAYDRVLAYLATLPEEAARRGRDSGRGMSHAVRDLTVYVTTLRDDLGTE